MMQSADVSIPITLLRVRFFESFVVAVIAINQQIFDGYNANIKWSVKVGHNSKAMDLALLKHLLKKLAQSTRKKKEMQHAKEAMKDETVIT